jgi:DNA (cytosine-5)-methyltransferase 1
MRKYRVVELYAGVARTWDAFSSWKKCSLALLVDNDEFAKEVYTLNAPKAPYIRRSLRRMSADELATLAGGRVDILLGCPPCQGFSDTGKRDPEDPRNDHITAYGRFIEGLRPLAVVMENVPLLANSPKFQHFKRRLERCGYVHTTQIVNAAQHGSCQTRQRLVLIAIHKTVREQPVIDSPSHGGGGRYFSYQRQLLVPITQYPNELLGITPAAWRMQSSVKVDKTFGSLPIPTVQDVLADLPRLGSGSAAALSHVAWPSSPGMVVRMSRVAEGGRWPGGEDHFSHAYGRLHRRGLARTITTYFSNPGSGRFWHPTEDRPLTVREAARIQGFQDDFKFSGPLSSCSRLIGNALDAAIASTAMRAVERCLA